jgi:hypothetical protein
MRDEFVNRKGEMMAALDWTPLEQALAQLEIGLREAAGVRGMKWCGMG